MVQLSDHPIVVGVDGSDQSLDATRWAAAEGHTRGRPVLLVHVHQPAVQPDAIDQVRLARLHESAYDAAAGLVARAAEVARAAAPYVPVDAEVRVGRTAHVLIEMSGQAAMVVLGHRGQGGFEARLLGSVAAGVAAHANCPAVVVRHGAAGREPEPGTVLVGTDGSPASDAAVGFAFEEADLRRGAVTVVHAWEPPSPPWRTDVRPLVRDAAEIETAEVHQVRKWVRSWSEKYPSVPVGVRLIGRRPAAALIDASPDAELLVVGSRGHGGFTGLLLGSVSQQVIHHAACPVAVIR